MITLVYSVSVRNRLLPSVATLYLCCDTSGLAGAETKYTMHVALPKNPKKLVQAS